MLKVIKGPKEGYSEVFQENPLRWKLCYKEGTTLIPQSDWWKCKDFLNDVIVYLRTGKEFDIYGFKNKQKINQEGGYLALKNVNEALDNNLLLLNNYLKSKGFNELQTIPFKADDKETEKVLLVPSQYWKNTFYISYITALIRACCFQSHTSFEKMVEDEEYLKNGWFNKLDSLFIPKLQDRMNELIFINYQYSGEKGFDNTYAIHNAGMQTWYNSKDTYLT